MTKSFVLRMGYLDGESQKFGHKMQFKRRTIFGRNSIEALPCRNTFIFHPKTNSLEFQRFGKSCESSSYLMMLISYLLCLLLCLTLLFVGIVLLSHSQQQILWFVSFRANEGFVSLSIYSKTRSVSKRRKRQINTNAKWC